MVGLDGGGACLAIAEISSSWIFSCACARFPWGNDFGRVGWHVAGMVAGYLCCIFVDCPTLAADFWRATGKSK
jgi:hypothetical protein